MTKLTSKIHYLYFSLIVIFSILNFFYNPKPILRNMVLKDQYRILDQTKSNIDSIEIFSNDNKVNIGKPFILRDKNHWYQINLLSFWGKEFLNLNLIDKIFKGNDFDIKTRNNNNFAQVTYKDEKIVYACIKDSETFFYKTNYSEIKNTYNFKYWKEVLTKNIRFIFYSFKPSNYECLFVITSDSDLFDMGKEELNVKILSKFIY